MPCYFLENWYNVMYDKQNANQFIFDGISLTYFFKKRNRTYGLKTIMKGVLIMILESDTLIEDFLHREENIKVLEDYMNNPNKRNKEVLDKQFKKHFYIIRCISYFIKMIHFESRHFDKKQRRRNEIYKLTLDKENDNGVHYIDLVVDFKGIECITKNLEEISEDPILHASINNLTEKQKRILYYIFVEEMKDIEVASVLGISQQAVTKAKRRALTKIRKGLSHGAGAIS